MAEEQDPPTQRFNTRPESTIAQNFASDLDAMFGLDSGGVDDLSRTVEEKKQTVTTGEQQLQELEAKLRETEERLARVSRHNSPSRHALPTANADNDQAGDGAPRPSPLAQKPTYPADRPPTAGDRPQSGRADTQTMMAGVPGAMPPHTPQPNGGSHDSYVMVDRSAAQAQRSYG
ncbi:hypothetical protein CLAFUW4_01413 [Fulvia fulva]|uniref:Uncharacterized protein n=1 Tax=Passalora fulva TaxID=5499 RepID=A0A9Q8P3H1_PASFU|nr:uncharacterized protein CLAFUR5_01415 [Fulvia fulva]KAK4634083.1 hypothetical protein CLAFUR4_01414 [Fulvia fulva]KAK4637259.1 hypothetical protein CLAFUR0_01415 [Fulvia fulva]UJO11789.1 hypothetical protein CLAFUR5_01415 [Fulvia fulva]WPV08109.1 hypothetical protein CLAFUW4_01413 [Fulvia fulva]WPV25103.1 hypothetical protein CLAFUW7_01418 [Fulvia fulva]